MRLSIEIVMSFTASSSFSGHSYGIKGQIPSPPKKQRANKDIGKCQNLHISTMQFSQLSLKKAQEDLNFIILKQDIQLL